MISFIDATHMCVYSGLTMGLFPARGLPSGQQFLNP